MRERPWGYKVTVSVYLAGDDYRAQVIADGLMREVPRLVPSANFIGVAVEATPDPPRDQVAT